jgi:hypothetical protein
VPAVIAAGLIAVGLGVVPAPPAHGAAPIPHVRPPVHSIPIHAPPSHSVPHPPEPASSLDDIVREVEPSNDPNMYALPDVRVPTGADRSTTPQLANEGDERDDSTDSAASTTDLRQDAGETAGTATVSTGTLPYAGGHDGDASGLSLRSIGLIGGVLVSVGSLAMWLVRKP